MSTEVVSASLADKEIVANLLQLYIHDLSEVGGWAINEHGRFTYHYLDHYWIEDGRYPFLFRVDDELAGFALVRVIAEGKTPVHSMAEFFILRKFRRTGVGETAATTLFDRFPGAWSISQIGPNLAARQFWRRVIGTYTHGAYTEERDERGRWIQHFSTPGKDSPQDTRTIQPPDALL